VRREYPYELALDDIARRVASSRRQLQRAFAEAGETTFRAYLQKVRMTRAAELLRDPGLPVNHVASAVGYRQPAQFAKAFRRHHGRPPSAYRQASRSLAA
jgi:two-component system response regulator YesN